MDVDMMNSITADGWGAANQPLSQNNISIPEHLTQDMVEADPDLKRLQQDLLILTSFNENDTLHWRPSWFKQEPFNKQFWTLYNPPNVVTELLTQSYLNRAVFTRRLRRDGDPAPVLIKTWEQWEKVCLLRGIPSDFLCKDQIRVMRLGLPRNKDGTLCAPPNYPLYPEPQPLGQGRYILDPTTYITHLPPKFHMVNASATEPENVQIVVVHSNGALVIEDRENFFLHSSQWTHYTGHGDYRADQDYVPDMTVPKEQGKNRRWSYLPWTKEMEESCISDNDNASINAPEGSGLKLKVKFWNSAMQDGLNTAPRRSQRNARGSDL